MTTSIGDFGPVGQCRGSNFGFFFRWCVVCFEFNDLFSSSSRIVALRIWLCFVRIWFVWSHMTHSCRHIALQTYGLVYVLLGIEDVLFGFGYV